MTDKINRKECTKQKLSHVIKIGQFHRPQCGLNISVLQPFQNTARTFSEAVRILALLKKIRKNKRKKECTLQCLEKGLLRFQRQRFQS